LLVFSKHSELICNVLISHILNITNQACNNAAFICHRKCPTYKVVITRLSHSSTLLSERTGIIEDTGLFLA